MLYGSPKLYFGKRGSYIILRLFTYKKMLSNSAKLMLINVNKGDLQN